MSTTSETKNLALNLWILWASLLGSQFVYLFIVGSRPTPVVPQPGLPVLAFTVLAVLLGCGALAANELLLGRERLRQWLLDCRQGKEGMDRPAAERVALTKLLPVSVLVWALAESVTLVGLMLAFIGQITLGRFALFLASGVLVHVLCLPKARLVDTLSREVYP